MTGVKRPSLETAFTLVELMIAIVIVVVIIGIATPVYNRVVSASRAASCVSNLRSLHQVMNLYSTDHQNCFPVGYSSPDTWTKILNDYRQVSHNDKAGINYCPATSLSGTGIYKRDATTWRTDYNINRFVATEKREENNRALIPGRLIFLFDGNGTTAGSASTAKEAKRHSGSFNIIFVDGHVETASEMSKYDNCWKR